MTNSGDKKNRMLKAGSILALTSLVAAAAFYWYETAPQSFDTGTMVFLEIPAGAKFDATLAAAGSGLRALNAADRGKILTPPYKLASSLQYAPGRYNDIDLSLSAGGKEFYLIADGFSPQDEITLTLNDNVLYSAVRFDWSGRIELFVPLEGKHDSKACVDIAGKDHDLSFCHTLAGEKKA